MDDKITEANLGRYREDWSASASSNDPVVVGEICPRKPYLEVGVPWEAASVRWLKVTTVSHDQGKYLCLRLS